MKGCLQPGERWRRYYIISSDIGDRGLGDRHIGDCALRYREAGDIGIEDSTRRVGDSDLGDRKAD